MRCARGIVGMIATPATRVAGVLQAPAGQLARVFGAFARKDQEAAEAAQTAIGLDRRSRDRDNMPRMLKE